MKVKKTEENKVIKVFRKENAYLRERNWKGAYFCFSPAFRKICPYKLFKRIVSDLSDLGQKMFGEVKAKFKFTDLKVRIEKDTAFLSYKIQIDKKTIYSTPPGWEDVFVKVRGKWYDSGEWISPYVRGEIDSSKSMEVRPP